MTFFISNRMEAEHRFLGNPCSQAQSAFGQSVVFFRLSPRYVVCCCLSFGNSFSREARNYLAQPMKVNTFERALVEAYANRFPSSATAHQCAQMSVPVSPHGSSSNQELSTRAARCVAPEFVMSLFPFNDQLEASQGGKRLIGVPMVVADLFQIVLQKIRCLAIQLWIRLTVSQWPNGFCTTIQTATWPLGMDRSRRLSGTWE